VPRQIWQPLFFFSTSAPAFQLCLSCPPSC
jgi:hypothetical protein